jgi:hypothetical protein
LQSLTLAGGRKEELVKKRISILLALGGTLLVLFACDSVPTHGTTIPAAHVPASAVNVSLTIASQFIGGNPPGTVNIIAIFANASGTFVLSGKQKFTCDGFMLPMYSASVRRQPPGSVYTCVYTDDQGKQTTLLVPAPQGSFAMTDPLPNATVTIPVSVKRPLPTTQFSGSQRPAEYTSTLHMHYQFPPLPQGATATLTAVVRSSKPPEPGITGTDEPATGTYDLSDAQTAYGAGFESFQPGPGSLEVNSTIIWPAVPPGGFHAVKYTYLDSLSIPVQWACALPSGSLCN